jgi:tetrapyrrole methylase family protein/MazG family protein
LPGGGIISNICKAEFQRLFHAFMRILKKMEGKIPKDFELYDADIYILGLGCFELLQVTSETLDILKRSQQILHLTSRHQDLLEINPNTQDLTPLYLKPGRDWDIYVEIAQYVISATATARPTAFVVQGNPMIFNDISWEIARLGKKAGLRVQALPGVSCIDVIPIQLGFDMGDLGIQIFEATQLVLFQLEINPYLSTLILQISEFGTSRLLEANKKLADSFDTLVSHLAKFFPQDHPAIFVRSTSSKRDPTVILATDLISIDEHLDRIVPGMTLYLPRIGIPSVNEEIAGKFNL